MKILEEIKGVFVPPVKKIYLGKIKHHTPYFPPMRFVPTILRIRKLKFKSEQQLAEEKEKFPHRIKYEIYSNMPWVRRSKDWILKLWGNHYWVQIGYPFKIHRNELGWKDKWNTPRFEWTPSYQIWFFRWQYAVHWVAPEVTDHISGEVEFNPDRYWEMVLWYLYYAGKDIKKAEETWGWVTRNSKDEKVSTWNPNYLI